MNKLDQILLKKKILSIFKLRSGVKIENESFLVVGITNEGNLIINQNVPIGAEERLVGSIVTINDLSFAVIDGSHRNIELELLSTKITGHDNTESVFFFDRNLKKIEKKFILEDYTINSEIYIDGVAFIVTKNNEYEVTLMPISSELWYKVNNDSTRCRYIENDEIIESTL